MRYPGRLKRWSSRSSVRVTGVAVVLVATGLVASGATAATGSQPAKLSLNYSCTFPAGMRAVTAQVTATFPATGTAGAPIQPSGAGVSVTLPPAVVSYLHGLRATSLMVSAAVNTQVTAAGTSATALWQRFISPVTALPASGSLGVATSGAVPSVTVKVAGKATFSVLNLMLLLRPYQAPGQATSPSSLLVGCTLRAGQDTTLATVPVAGATSPPEPGTSAIAVGSQPTGSSAPAGTGTNWSSLPGGKISGSASTVTLKDGATGTSVTCSSSSAAATLKSGTGLPGTGIGSFTSVTFKGCSGPAHQALTLTASGFPWFLNVNTYDATALVTGGTITGIHAVLSGSGCDATLDGTSATAGNGTTQMTYSSSTSILQTLTNGGNLHLYNVKGCSGLGSGDAVTLAAGYAISPQQTITDLCSPLPRKNFQLNPRFPVPRPPPHPPGEHPSHFAEPGCAYIAGFSNVRKLNEAALIGPGLTQLTLGLTTYDYCYPSSPNPHKDCSLVNYFQVDAAGKLEYQGKPQFPPATATLLAFGFMPVSATLQLTELGTVNAIGIGRAVSSPPTCTHKCQTVFTVSSRVSLRIYDVKVNGVPLNVGTHCQTSSPFNIVLRGVSPQYTINTGGVLTGTVKLPSFAGCGVGENLDPIFTAPVSGPGNIVKLTQAPPCIIPGGTFGCPPAKPVPVH